MAKRLDETVGSVGFENLFNGTYPPAEVFSVQVAAGQGVLKRGSLLASSDNGMKLIGNDTTGKANAVLAETVDTGELMDGLDESDGSDGSEETSGTVEVGEAVEAIAYRTGHFNTNALIVSEGYEITDADKEALRIAGILTSDAVEI